MFHRKFLSCWAGPLKLYVSYASSVSWVRFSMWSMKSWSIGVIVGFVFGLSNIITNFEMFSNLFRDFFSDLIFSFEHVKSPLDRSPSVAAQNLRASAPSSFRISCGSITLPRDFDIFRPLPSRIC